MSHSPSFFAVWQQPYVNVFKHFNLQSWKKASKEGDVAPVMVSDRSRTSSFWKCAPFGNPHWCNTLGDLGFTFARAFYISSCQSKIEVEVLANFYLGYAGKISIKKGKIMLLLLILLYRT